MTAFLKPSFFFGDHLERVQPVRPQRHVVQLLAVAAHDRGVHQRRPGGVGVEDLLGLEVDLGAVGLVEGLLPLQAEVRELLVLPERDVGGAWGGLAVSAESSP